MNPVFALVRRAVVALTTMLVVLVPVGRLGAAQRPQLVAATPDSSRHPGMNGEATDTTLPFPVSPRVRLVVPGNSRLATDLSGRDSALTHLSLLGLSEPRPLPCNGPFLLGAGESAWLTSAAIPGLRHAVNTLVLTRADSNGTVEEITVLFHDEPALARLLPRDDGVVRTSLAEQRNRAAVRRLHGEGVPFGVLAARGDRVFVMVAGSADTGAGWQLAAYTFEANGSVRSLTAAPPLRAALTRIVR